LEGKDTTYNITRSSASSVHSNDICASRMLAHLAASYYYGECSHLVDSVYYYSSFI